MLMTCDRKFFYLIFLEFIFSTSSSPNQRGATAGPPCISLMVPLNGRITYSQGDFSFPSGTIATLICNFGYSISGISSATCQNGLWTPPSLGQCISGLNPGISGGTTSSQCIVGLSPVANGLINYSNGLQYGPWPVGSSASLTCNAGFFPSGTTISTCSGNGQFLPAVLGPCTSSSSGNIATPGLTCPALLPIGGTITYSSPGPPPYAQGTTATLFCNLGYTLSGIPTVLCQGGLWTPSSGLGTCLLSTLQKRPIEAIIVQHGTTEEDKNFCPAPIASPFGEITFSKVSNSSGFPQGTTAALRCTMGRYIIGPSFATCSHGAFRPVLGKCTDGRENALPGVCLPLTPPINGRITYIQSGRLDNFEVGTTALLYCLESFAVTGQATVVCSKDGWQPASGLGECDPIIRKL